MFSNRREIMSWNLHQTLRRHSADIRLTKIIGEDMSSYKSVLKPSFEIEYPEKGIPLIDLAETLLDLEKTLEAAPIAVSQSSKTKKKDKIPKPQVKSYFRGSKNKCIELEIFYEVEDNDENLKVLCVDEQCNIAKYYLELIKENIHYNTIASDSKVVLEKSNQDKIVMESDGEEITFSAMAVQINQVKSYKNKIMKFLIHIGSSPEITSFTIGLQNDLAPYTVPQKRLNELVESQSEETHKKENQYIRNTRVIIISPYLAEKHKKWIVMFNPKLPQGLVYSSNHEFKATIIDKTYLANLKKKKFGMGDKLTCDISYDIEWQEGSDIARITNIEIDKVREHE